jgi:hypothetical protein
MAQSVKKFPSFCATQRFITVFTKVSHQYLSWARPIQSTPSHRISLRSILILSSHQRVGFPIISSLQTSQIKFCTHFYVPHASYMPCPSHFPWFVLSNNIIYWWYNISVLSHLNSNPVKLCLCSVIGSSSTDKLFLVLCVILPLKLKERRQLLQIRVFWN